MRTLLWIAILIFAVQLGFQLLDRIGADGAPWWLDLLATLGVGVALSYLFQQAFGRYRPARKSSRVFGDAGADHRADRPEPITPRMFSSPRRDPDPPQR